MRDPIERQDAIDEIRKCRFVVDAIEKIIGLPSVQPEIIRCKDCKHYYFADNRIPQEQRYVCDLNGDRWKFDDYCSFAERKDSEADE